MKIKITESQFEWLVNNIYDEMLLNEQNNIEGEDIKLKYNFGNYFPHNMVQLPKNVSIDQLREIKDFVNNIKSYIDKKYTITELDLEVISSASSLPATNGLPQGITKPDHDYNGKLDMKVCHSGEKDNCWLPYNRRNERKIIPEGNIYLAKMRGEYFKNKLIEYFTKIFPQYDWKNHITFKFNTQEKVPDTQSDRYVRLFVNGNLKPPAPPIKEFLYYIRIESYNYDNKEDLIRVKNEKYYDSAIKIRDKYFYQLPKTYGDKKIKRGKNPNFAHTHYYYDNYEEWYKQVNKLNLFYGGSDKMTTYSFNLNNAKTLGAADFIETKRKPALLSVDDK